MILLHFHVDYRLVPSTYVQTEDKRVGIILPDGSPENIQWSVWVHYSILHTLWGLLVGCRPTRQHWHLADLPQLHFQLFKKWMTTFKQMIWYLPCDYCCFAKAQRWAVSQFTPFLSTSLPQHSNIIFYWDFVLVSVTQDKTPSAYSYLKIPNE